MKYGCIGEKLGHSFSKEIHESFAPYPYELCELAPEELPSFLQKKEFCGINVTIPYKEKVIPYLDEIAPEAAAIGAVNTIVNRGGRLCGFNTDFAGMKALLAKEKISLENKKVLILGTGGTSKTAKALTMHLGARAVLRVSRSAREDAVSYEEALAAHTDAEVILNTTPCGMFPKAGVSPIDLSAFSCLSGVADAIYNPLCSQLVLDAKARGIPASGGLYMLVAQAVFAAGIFLDTEFPGSEIEHIYQSLLKKKQNLVLIGMPASGKSTLGKAAAAALNRSFFDSDEAVEAAAGKSIPRIFAEEGESGFRDRESAQIKALSEKQGIVLATGGGAVLREENRKALRSNGFLVFLDRPLSFLQATSDRPLSSNREDLEKRYRERYDVYCRTADFRFLAGESVSDNVNAILEEFLK